MEELNFKEIDQKYGHTNGKTIYSRQMLLNWLLWLGLMVFFHLGGLLSFQRNNGIICIFPEWVSLISVQLVGLKLNAQNKFENAFYLL